MQAKEWVTKKRQGILQANGASLFGRKLRNYFTHLNFIRRRYGGCFGYRECNDSTEVPYETDKNTALAPREYGPRHTVPTFHKNNNDGDTWQLTFTQPPTTLIIISLNLQRLVIDIILIL